MDLSDVFLCSIIALSAVLRNHSRASECRPRLGGNQARHNQPRKKTQICSKPNCQTATLLEEARLIRINRSDFSYCPTSWGRIGAKFYVDWETVKKFREKLDSGELDDSHLLQFFGRAKEFQGLKVGLYLLLHLKKILQVRPEEMSELIKFSQTRFGCVIPPITGIEDIEGKVSVLLQAYLSR